MLGAAARPLGCLFRPVTARLMTVLVRPLPSVHMSISAPGDVAQRRAEILRLAREGGRRETVASARRLGVSVETLRRDLRTLEQEGQILRSHGGFVAAETGRFEQELGDRDASESEQKRRIVASAAGMLSEASTVFLDEGVIPTMLVRHLPVDRVLTVVTPSLPTATAVLESTRHELVMVGGTVRRVSHGAVGQWTVEFLRRCYVDVAFLGANGVSLDNGLTTPDPEVAAMKRVALENSRMRVLLCEHLRFGVTSFSRFAGIEELTHIVTGRELSRSRAQRYGAEGPRVLRV